MKLTKNELRIQQARLTQLSRYLPTLQLKKAMLQYEVDLAQREVAALKEDHQTAFNQVSAFSPLLLEKVDANLSHMAYVELVQKTYENVAGVEIPRFDGIRFRNVDYFLFDSPVWTESAGEQLRSLVVLREKVAIGQEKLTALEKELREVSIRVNLFEKVLIPRAAQHIKKIRIFLSDQQLTAVAQAKVAKAKLLAKRSV